MKPQDASRLERIESELTHSAFTPEFSTRKEDYLLISPT